MDFPPVPLWLVKSPACEHGALAECRHQSWQRGAAPMLGHSPQPTQGPPWEPSGKGVRKHPMIAGLI